LVVQMTNQQIDLKQIEKKAWTSFYKDGVWELALGLAMMIIWIDMITQDRLAWLMPAAMFTVPLIIYLIKRFVVIPRIGYVKFGAARRARNLKAVVVLVVSVLIGIAMAFAAGGMIPNFYSWLGDNWISIFFLVKALIIFSLLAWLMDYPPLYYSGTVFAFGLGLGSLFHSQLIFLASWLLILIPGILIFIRFLMRYPIPREEAVR
jgi:hypothetical protein